MIALKEASITISPKDEVALYTRNVVKVDHRTDSGIIDCSDSLTKLKVTPD